MITHTKALAAAFALAALLCLWQRSEIRSLETELAQVETNLVKARARVIETTLSATTQALAMRDTAYAENRDTGREAQQVIVSAAPENDRAAPDDFIPDALSDALLMQHARVRAGCGGDSPTGTAIHAESSTGAACSTGTIYDRASDGAVALPVYRMGW